MNSGYDVFDIDQALFVSLETGLIHCCRTKQELLELMALKQPFEATENVNH
jgi:hypothetical protein